jgi:hypothetical protein
MRTVMIAAALVEMLVAIDRNASEKKSRTRMRYS